MKTRWLRRILLIFVAFVVIFVLDLVFVLISTAFILLKVAGGYLVGIRKNRKLVLVAELMVLIVW